MSKRLQTVLGLLISTCAVALSAACGSSDESGGDGGQAGSGANGAGGTINVGSGGTTGFGTPQQDGGSVPLTPTERDAIANSACAGWMAEGEALPAVLQLVVDVSGSMEDPPPGGGSSKWDITREALRTAIAGLPDSVSIGVLYYPNQDTGSSDTPRNVSECVNVSEMVPISVLGATGHRALVDGSLDQANTGSLTPTHDAYRYALAMGLMAYQTNLRKFMLLITDGAPTMAQDCVGDSNNVTDAPTQPIIDEIAGAYAVGISTFLIGSPGSEQSSESNSDMRPWLSRAAIVGGTAASGCQEAGPNFCHMDMTQEPDFAQALANGLRAVVGQVVDSCTFAIPTPPAGQTVNPNQTNLVITWSNGDASLILPDGIGDCSEGWQFTGTDQVTLCAASCDAIKADAGARVQLTFGCRTDEVIPVR